VCGTVLVEANLAGEVAGGLQLGSACRRDAETGRLLLLGRQPDEAFVLVFAFAFDLLVAFLAALAFGAVVVVIRMSDLHLCGGDLLLAEQDGAAANDASDDDCHHGDALLVGDSHVVSFPSDRRCGR
jgi:hypothetical protein